MKFYADSLKKWKWGIIFTLLGALLFVAPVLAPSKNEIKISNYEDIGSLDPGWYISEPRDFLVMSCIYDGLFKYEEGSWKVVPSLVESWDVSPDHCKIIFKLRKGVQFHKGYGELTAEDVKFTYERLFAPDCDATEKKQLEAIDHLDVLDKYTVRMVLKRPMAQLFTLTLPMHTGFIISKKAYEKLGKDGFRMHPVGSGPYELESWEPKTRTVLKAFNDYWRGKPKIDKVVIIPIPDETTADTGLKTGEIDIGYFPLRNIKFYEKDPKFNLINKPATYWIWIGFTHDKPPFDNLKLRQAFRYTVNVDKILEVVFFGAAKRANAIFPSGTYGHWKDAPVYKQDLAKAKQLLKEAGKPDGFKATLNCANVDFNKVIGEIIKADAAKVGIDLEISVNEVGAFNEANKAGRYNMFVERWSYYMDPHMTLKHLTTDSKWNITRWNNKEFDELVLKAESEMNPAKRESMYVRAQQVMDEECYGIFLTNGVRAWVTQKDIDAGKVYPNGRLAPWTMSFK